MAPPATSFICKCDLKSVPALLDDIADETLSVALQAAAHGVRHAVIKHFRAREQEPANNAGFPRFGQTWPKRHFWSVAAEAVGEAIVDENNAVVSISGPSGFALAHKDDPNPPLIIPTGGRRYLAIPANERAAAWDAMPRDFLGGNLAFVFAKAPDGSWRPALAARSNHMRTVSKGRNSGHRVMAKGTSKATSGIGEVQYWLVRKVQTKHDPCVLPPISDMADEAARAATNAINSIGAKHV